MAKAKRADEVLRIGEVEVRPGQRLTVNLPIADLYTNTELTMPIRVMRGRRAGPTLFVSAAVHGDEINGVEIIRRLLRLKLLKRLRGTLIAVPVVHGFGLRSQSRCLPEGRDRKRRFRGSERGARAARLADLFMTEIVSHCTHGIDLHTGSNHRTNLPQIRAWLDDPETARLATVFGVPVVLGAELRDGSLREAVAERGLPVLLYEAGEALRFDEMAIRFGVRGIVSVMRAIEMLPGKRTGRPPAPLLALESTWVRAPHSGLLRVRVPLGRRVKKDELLGAIAHPLGRHEVEVRAPKAGIIIGQVMLPLVNEGEALFHIALVDPDSAAPEALELLAGEGEVDPGK